MAGLANNLLDMARLEAGAVVLNRQWQLLDEVVGGALAGMTTRMVDHPVTVKAAARLAFGRDRQPADREGIREPAGKREVHADRNTHRNFSRNWPERISGDCIRSRPRNSSREESRIFEKFHRVDSEGNQSGAGLGLTICRSIVEAHGGRIWADNLPSGGAAFHFALPLTESPPVIEHEEIIAEL